MLAEERYSRILTIVNAQHSVTVASLMQALDVSESTVRRDLSDLDHEGKLIKVHGGAIAVDTEYALHDDDTEIRRKENPTKKETLGRFAAGLLQKNDFVYIDAGTTTYCLCDYIDRTDIVVVTNAVEHAKKLSKKGILVYVLGGRYKSETEAVVGEEAVESLAKYNFTKAFLGSNGVSRSKGYSTPEANEAMVKKMAVKNAKEVYFLCDDSKLDKISCVSFADFADGTLIVNKNDNLEYKNLENVVELGE